MKGCLTVQIGLLAIGISRRISPCHCDKKLQLNYTGYLQPDRVSPTSVQPAGYRSSMNTYRVVNVKPFGCVGLDKLAIDEQLGGGLEDHRSIWFNLIRPDYITTKFTEDMYQSPHA